MLSGISATSSDNKQLICAYGVWLGKVNYSDYFFSWNIVTSNSRNKTLVLRISIDAYDWNFARVSWNTVETGKSHVVYRIIYKAGNDVIDQLTSNTSVVLSGLNQLTTYTITVKALGNDGTLPLLSTEAHLSTLGQS